MSQTAYRTHHATEVTEALVGEQVTLAGWVDRRRDHGGVAFVDLRDSSGLVQVVINDEEMARPLRSEFVIRVNGTVRLRPEGNENEHLATGRIEVVAKSIEILAKSDALPFQVSTALENESENKLPGEDVRLKYRYLDLRRPSMQRNIKLRSDMAKAARQALDEMGFTEVETPTMIKSTPEGARDFLVPARLVPGSWYALPQSPQLLKQLLMVSGVERYYQIARCYRDEDFRADRQPEFTQLDMEMAFVDQEDVIAMAEKVIAAIWKAAGYEVKLPIQRITWQEAMDKYGTDKPDLRFGNELIELTEYFKDTPFRVFQAPYVGAVLFKGGAATPRRQFDAWQDWAKQRGAKGLAYVVFAEDGELKGPVAKNLSEAERAGLKQAVGAEDGDAVFFAAGPRASSQNLLGAVRVELADRAGLLKPDDFAFTWVVDFPLFKSTDRHVRPGSGTRDERLLRHRLQWRGDGRRFRPYPPRRHPGPRPRRARHLQGGGRREVRLPARGIQVRRPAARGHRLGLGPHRLHPGRHRYDPRRHRLPEGRRRPRPAHRRPRPDHGRAARRNRRRLRSG